MQDRTLKIKAWLSLREATIEIGRHQLGEAWHEQILERDSRDQTLRRVRGDVFKMFESGEVEILLDEVTKQHKFHPKEALDPAFSFDIKRSSVLIRGLHRFQCRIRRESLLNFLTKYAHTRVPDRQQAKGNALSWLEDEMRKSPIKTQPKLHFKKALKSRYGTSDRAFEELWKQAQESTGTNWSTPGRPKSSR